MPRLSIWQGGVKRNDYKFIDRTISEFFSASGTAAYIHKYNGIYSQAAPTLNADGTTSPAVDPTNPTPQATNNPTSIQDVLLLENRDRSYDPNVYELRTIYNVGDSDFDLRQFGMFLTNDTYFLEFAFNDMIALLGRKLMSGDVIELPHQRDEFLLNGGPATNAFYVVEDANRASDGYSATWYYHIWRVKVSPMTASQEFNDILAQQAVNPLGLPMTNPDGSAATLGSLMSDVASALNINQAVYDDAVANFTNRYFETQQFWIGNTTNHAGDELTTQNPWVFAGDGIPPDGASLLGQGNSFPLNPEVGSYYLRTDYSPSVLFQYVVPQTGTFSSSNLSAIWQRVEVNWRGTWSAASRLLEGFINSNSTYTKQDGTTAPSKVNLSQAIIIKPSIDL